jgi:hypothetical protein
MPSHLKDAKDAGFLEKSQPKTKNPFWFAFPYAKRMHGYACKSEAIGLREFK